MTDRKFQRVRLQDGPLAGRHRLVRREAKIATFTVYEEPSGWTVGGREWTRIHQATYRRLDDVTWGFVRTPEALGDNVLEELP